MFDWPLDPDSFGQGEQASERAREPASAREALDRRPSAGWPQRLVGRRRRVRAAITASSV